MMYLYGIMRLTRRRTASVASRARSSTPVPKSIPTPLSSESSDKSGPDHITGALDVGNGKSKLLNPPTISESSEKYGAIIARLEQQLQSLLHEKNALERGQQAWLTEKQTLMAEKQRLVTSYPMIFN